MLKHIVFIKLNESYSKQAKEQVLKKIEQILNELPKYIDEIITLETGINFNSRPTAFDLSLSIDFKDKTDLSTYQVHPKHQEVLAHLGTLDLKTAVVDYFK